ncbi:hypothetical protein BJ138DRAFT_1019633, partial [Hygrophoropsis aurantiaca]
MHRPGKNLCAYCGKSFPTPTRVKRHVSSAAACKKQWEKQVTQRTRKPSQIPQQQAEVFVPSRSASPPHLNNNDPIFMPDSPSEHADPLSKRARVEEVEDEEAGGPTRFAQVFPSSRTAEILGRGKTAFEELKERQESDGTNLYGPFDDEAEWELAQ